MILGIIACFACAAIAYACGRLGASVCNSYKGWHIEGWEGLFGDYYVTAQKGRQIAYIKLTNHTAEVDKFISTYEPI